MIFTRKSKKKFVIAISIAAILVFFNITCIWCADSKLLSRVDTEKKLIALTFDGGSDVGNSSKILDILDKHKIKCTFFLTGKFTEKNPESAKKIHANGHEIGNHSYSHPYFTQISTEKMKNEILKTEDIIEAAIEGPVQPLFRPPYGAYNSKALKTIGEYGYKWTVMWTIDTIDWNGTSSAAMISKVLDKAKPGAIVLMHLGSGTHTTEALPDMITGLKDKGYKITTVSDMLTNSCKTVTPPQGNTYTIVKGDTLWAISRKFGVTVEKLVELNKIAKPNLIYPGQVLALP